MTEEDYQKFRMVSGKLVEQARLEHRLAESRQQVASMMARSADIMASPKVTLAAPFRGQEGVSERDVHLIREVAQYITGISYDLEPSIGEFGD